MTEKRKTTARIWHPFTQMKTESPPIHISSGNGVWLHDRTGNRYIDAISSWWVNLHGHAHPVIADAIHKQALELEHVIFAGFTHRPAEEFACRLVAHLPSGLNNVFFSDNGSTAVEVAIKMCVQFFHNQGEGLRNRFIAFRNAYHGDTIGAMSAGGRGTFSLPFHDLMFETDYVDFPSTWEGDNLAMQREDATIEQIGKLFGQYPGRHAAVIIEPLVQGAGGMNICRPDFLHKLRTLCNTRGIHLIFDEVMTGFGRTGHWFASRKADVSPDLICLSKGITGGFLPLSVTVATDPVYDAFYSNDRNRTFFHGHSYTANPLACAAANASLSLLEQGEAQFMHMEMLHRKHAAPVKDLKGVSGFRFCGTIAAWEVNTDENSGYLNPVGGVIRSRMLERGVVMRPLGDTMYVMPPYIISDNELATIYNAAAEVISEL